jgi:hypothetical protein
MLGSHVRYLCNLNFLAQFLISLLYSFNFLMQYLQLHRFIINVVLRIIDTEFIVFYVCLNFRNQIMLLSHSIPDIKFSIKFRDEVVEATEEL